MSDDLRKAVERLQGAMLDVRGDLQDLRASQRLTVKQTQEIAAQMQALASQNESTAQKTDKLARTFEGFQVRVNEAMEMVVRHDTEQLQRVARVEKANDALRQEWADLRSRVEVLEKKAG